MPNPKKDPFEQTRQLEQELEAILTAHGRRRAKYQRIVALGFDPEIAKEVLDLHRKQQRKLKWHGLAKR